MTNTNTTVKIYPDNKAGVIAMLNAESDLTLTGKETYTPDPEVDGVWSVTDIEGNDGAVQAIVYLAGYATPFGDKRQDNDFECEYDDDVFGWEDC